MQQLEEDNLYFVSGTALAYTHITEQTGSGMGEKRGICHPCYLRSSGQGPLWGSVHIGPSSFLARALEAEKVKIGGTGRAKTCVVFQVRASALPLLVAALNQ
jgi:hypothetical protein